MEAFHSFWSEPNKGRNGGSIRIPDYEQLTAILSALEWRRHNGPIRMITDTEGLHFLEAAGLAPFWDRIETTLDTLSGRADPYLFWAAGKLFALQEMPSPCVMLDTDLIVWGNVDQLLAGSRIAAAHAEPLMPQVYPDASVFRLKDGSHFPKEWDFTLDAANTAFLFLRDAGFKKKYTEAALEFLGHVSPEGLNPVTAMCFAEQRILPMCAAAAGLRVDFLTTMEEADEQELLTHTWGFKQVMEELAEPRDQFCMRCVRRIAVSHPESAGLLLDCPALKDYYLRYEYTSSSPAS